MNEFKTFEELAANTRTKVVALGTTSRTVLKNFNRCIYLLANYLEGKNLDFSKDVALEWLVKYETKKKKGTNYTVYTSFRRTILLLCENENGTLNDWKIYPRIIAQMPNSNDYLHLLSEYEKYLKGESYRLATIEFKFRCAKSLLIYLENERIYLIINIKHQDIADYLISNHFKARKPAGVQAELSRLRHFIIFLEERCLVTKNLNDALPHYRLTEKKIITTISDEIETILLKDYPTFPANKRDKAIYLLALHSGLRCSDINNLCLSNINWNKKTITIVQVKTDVLLTIFLDTETINSLIDYILNERRKTDNEYVFISAIGPIRKLATHYHHTMDVRLNKYDIGKEVPQMGLHILRRTFASRLLRSGAELAVITGALGQTDFDTVNVYLSTDEVNMKRCALDLQGIACTRNEYSYE